jgi:hypothetical protein
MKETTNITLQKFHQAFKETTYYKNTFSDQALDALYEYLLDYEQSIGEEIELDVIELAGEFSELSYEDFWDTYLKNSYQKAVSKHETVIDPLTIGWQEWAKLLRNKNDEVIYYLPYPEDFFDTIVKVLDKTILVHNP